MKRMMSVVATLVLLALILSGVTAQPAGANDEAAKAEASLEDLRSPGEVLAALAADLSEEISTRNGFAGVYLRADGDEGKPIVLQVTAESDVNSVLGSLDSTVEEQTDIELVKHSRAEISHAQDLIEPLIGPRGITGVGVDVRGNGLHVLVTDDLDQARAEIVRVGIKDIPISFEIGKNTENTCSNRLNCGGSNARRAGVALDKGSSDCTSGYNILYNGAKYGLTAGHCFYGQTSGSVTSGSQSFGWLNSSNFYYHNSWCDCRLISNSGDTKNRLYRTDSDKYQAVSYKSSHVVTGQSVNFRGRWTQSSGTVSLLDYSYWANSCGCILNGAALASYSNIVGDSGGAVGSYSGLTAYGINSGNSGSSSRFFEVARIEWFGGSILTN